MQKNDAFENAKKIFTGKEIEETNYFFINTLLSNVPDSLILSIKVNEYLFYVPDWCIKKIIKYGILVRKTPPYIFYGQKKKALKSIMLHEKISRLFCTNVRHTEEIIRLIEKQGIKSESLFGLKEGV